MKKISMLSLMLMGAFAVSNANAQITYNLPTGHGAEATINQALKVANGSNNLNFGTNTLTFGQGGTVLIKPGATDNVTPSEAVTQELNSAHSGDITVWGPAGATVTISEGSVTLGGDGTSSPMSITLPTLYKSGTTTPAATLTISGSEGEGADGLAIKTGGTLSIGANQPAGAYSGYLPVKIQY